MKGIKVEVNLDELIVGTRYTGDPDDPDGGPVTLIDAVVEEVGRLVLQSIKNDTTRDTYRSLRDRAATIRDEEIRAAIKPAIEQAVTATMQPTDGYGNPKGEPKTTHELIVEHATKVLTAKNNDHYSRDKGQNIVEQFIAKEVQAVLNKELKAALEQAKADVMRAVKDQGAKVLSETIARMAGVK